MTSAQQVHNMRSTNRVNYSGKMLESGIEGIFHHKRAWKAQKVDSKSIDSFVSSKNLPDNISALYPSHDVSGGETTIICDLR